MNKLPVTSYKLQVIDNSRANSRVETGRSVFLSLFRRERKNGSAQRTQKTEGAAHLPGGSRALFVLLAITLLHYYTITPLHAAYSGGQPGMLLSWGAGARSLAMGKAFVAVADDASATYWNPAAMSQIVRKELMGLHVALWEDTDYNFLSYVHPTAKFGVFGINYTSLRSGGFKKYEVLKWNPDGSIPADGKGIWGTQEFKDAQSAVTLAYGKKVLENYIQNLSAGIATKFLSRQLDTSKDSHFSFDTTLFLDSLNSYPISIGFKIQNLLTFARGDTDDRLPLTFRFGAAYRTMRERLILAADLDKMVTANFGWHVGAEYWLLDFAAVRMGFEGQEKALVESTVGFGLKYRNYGLDYAFALHDLGPSHRFSGTWRFGASVVAKREEAIRRFYREGWEAYRTGDYALSVERLNKLLDIDPRNREAKTLVAKLETILPITPKVVEPTREAELTRRGIAAYVEGDMPTAINVLRYALSLQPQNDTILKVLNRAEKQVGERISEPELAAKVPTAFTYLDQKLYQALEYIYNKQYDKAVLQCQEVLNLEPSNVTALERMGSALFLMNQRDLARKVWIKALEIDPNNLTVRSALERLK